MAVVIAGGFGERPQPPAELTKRQAEIWRAVVSSEHVDFFKTAVLRGLLADYCRHREEAERLSRILSTFKRDWVKDKDGRDSYDLLLRMRDRETRASIVHARSLRLTNQSRYFPDSAAVAARNAAKGSKPWEA